MARRIPVLGITMGDPAGVGPEITARALARPDVAASCKPVVIGDRSIMKAPRQVMAWILLFDAIHHRGQISTLIRPMGGKVPSIYGPSADTQMGG